MRITAIILALVLSGCSGMNLTPSTLQFSGQTMAFPDTYQSEAARVVQQQNGDPAQVTVSYPRTTVGLNALAPQRWYVCVRGITPKPTKATLPDVGEFAQRIVDPAGHTGIYDVLLFFSAKGARPSVRTGTDSDLCRDGQYERLTAEPPVI